MISNFAVPLVVLGIIVVVHELGHFLMAKLFKIKVETFSVGFGPRLIGFRYGETEYRISAFPLGGYVRMLGMSPGVALSGAPDEFMSKPRWQRFLVAAAGPAMNIVLAVAILTGLFMQGIEMPNPAAPVTTVVGSVQGSSAAASAGLKIGDEIVAVNGISVKSPERSVSETLQDVERETFPLTILRNGERLALSVTPVSKNGRKIIGVGFNSAKVFVQENFSAAFARSIKQNLHYAALISDVLGKLVTGEASMKAVDGPLSIMKATSESYEIGFGPLLMLMAMISVNLGLMNLLPIPILDGGLMLMLAIESLMGRDLSVRAKERVIQTGFVFLLSLTVFVSYNDVMKLLPPGQSMP